VLTTNTKCPNQVFYVWLVHLQTICDIYRLETWFSTNNVVRNCLLDEKHGITKNAFWGVNNKNDVNDISLFHFPYLKTIMVYLWSQWTPHFQIKNFMCDWSFYRLLVLNRGWKRDSFQIIIFVYVSSTVTIFEQKTRFETCITRNDVNCVSLFHLPYLLTLMV
jgi:hypothetical protein